MSDLVTICLVDFEEKAELYQAPHLAVEVGDEVQIDEIGHYGTVKAVLTEFFDSPEYQFACLASGWTIAEGLPRLIGRRIRKIFDYGEVRSA